MCTSAPCFGHRFNAPVGVAPNGVPGAPAQRAMASTGYLIEVQGGPQHLLAEAASEESTKNGNAALDKALNFLMESRVALACTTSDRILSAP